MAWWRRLANTFRRRRLDDDIDAELKFHVEMRAADLEREGMTADDARRTARRLLGNDAALRDRTRESDVWIRLETALQDARYAARLLWRTPIFTIAAACTLAVGIGVNTAMFGVVYGVLIRPLPYTDAERLHMVFQTSARGGRTRFAPLDFVDVNAQARTFSSAGIVGNGFTLSGNGDPELVIGHLATAQFFDLLGTRPLHGRTFGPADAAATNNDVIVLSHGLWMRRYGGDPAIVGRTIIANNRPYTVVGVMGSDFTFQSKRYQLWVPFPLKGPNPDNLPITRNSRYMQMMAKLHPGVAPEVAAEELRSIAAAMAKGSPNAATRHSSCRRSQKRPSVTSAIRCDCCLRR